MKARFIGAAVFGIAGVAVLLSLGFWQVQRLAWKTAMIEQIEGRIHNAPVPVPADAAEGDHRYLPVTAAGRYTGEAVFVLSSLTGTGPGARLIAVLETDEGRRLLVDRGFVAESRRSAVPLVAEGVSVTGNLDWPHDADAFTPAPDTARNLWFSRDPGPIAATLDAEPMLLVARQDSAAAPPLVTQPVSGVALRNDHLEYALTWFMLAAVWAVMTIALLWRIQRTNA